MGAFHGLEGRLCAESELCKVLGFVLAGSRLGLVKLSHQNNNVSMRVRSDTANEKAACFILRQLCFQ